jgi:hypothetical protein
MRMRLNGTRVVNDLAIDDSKNRTYLLEVLVADAEIVLVENHQSASLPTSIEPSLCSMLNW